MRTASGLRSVVVAYTATGHMSNHNAASGNGGGFSFRRCTIPQPSEFQIQRAYLMWFCGVPGKIEPAGLPGIVTWHTPNGGKRDPREAKLFKELGVLPGFPDVAHLWGTLHLIE